MIESSEQATPVSTETRSEFAGSRSVPRLWELLGLATTLIVFASLAVILISQGSPLGHDESVYATRARQFSQGEPPYEWWAPYRAPGLPLILSAAWLGSASDPYLRAIVAGTGASLIVFTWLLARLLLGRHVALVAAFGLSLTPVLLLSATQVWADVPGAAAAMATFYLYAYGLTKPRLPVTITVAVPLMVGAATLIRFGAPMVLFVGLLGLTLWRLPEALRNRWRVLAIAVGSGLAIFSILFTTILTEGMRPIDALLAQTADIPLSQGFIDYWALAPDLFSGAGWVALAGLGCGLILAIKNSALRSALLWPLSIGVATFVVLAAAVFGFPHYLVPVYPWLWIAAAVGLTGLAGVVPRSLSLSVGIVLLLVLAGLAPSLSDYVHEANERYAVIKAAATSLSAEKSCGVITSYTPQVAWYSGCDTVNIDPTRVDITSPDLAPGTHYLFIVERGKRQPDDELMARYMDKTTMVAQSFGEPGQPLQFVQLWTLRQ
jgi:4-amino-4-deoxy-L-arabinose transferase-like glycosyltransferase